MTAPLLTLPISAPAASGGGQAAPGAAGAMGFEALMAAFFATGEGEAGAALLGDGEKAEDATDTDALAVDAAPNSVVDAQTLAALLAVTPQQVSVQPLVTTESGETEQAPAGAPPAAFSPLLAQEVATAPATNATPAAEGDAPPVETAEVETPDLPVAAAPAQDDVAGTVETPQPQGPEKPRDSQAASVAQQVETKTAPTAQATAPQAPPPVEPENAANPVVQAQAAATEIETTAEPAKDHAPAKAPKTEAGRRNAAATAAAHAAGAAAVASANDAAQAATPVASAEDAGELALAIEGEPAAATSGGAKPQTTDTPDAQGPGATTAAAHNAAGPIAEAPLPVRGSPETVAHLAAQIVKKLEGRSTHFDVELNPIGLGQVTVSVEIGAQGKMTAALQFESAQAANELRGRAPELQKALEQAGFDLSGGGLSFDVAGDRGQGQGRGDLYQQQQQQQNESGWRGRAFQAVLDTADGAAEAAAAAALHLQRRPVTSVDVRV